MLPWALASIKKVPGTPDVQSDENILLTILVFNVTPAPTLNHANGPEEDTLTLLSALFTWLRTRFI